MYKKFRKHNSTFPSSIFFSYFHKMFKKANILKLKQFKFNIFKFVKNYKILYQNTRLWNNEGCVSEN